MADRFKEFRSICAVVGMIALPSIAPQLFPETALKFGSLCFAALAGAIGGAVGVVLGALVVLGVKMVSPNGGKGPPDGLSSR